MSPVRKFLIAALCVVFTGAGAKAQAPTSGADEIRKAYGEDSEKIGLVAEYSDHAILAWAAYRDEGALSLAADRGWDAMSYVIRGRRGLKVVQRARGSDDVVAVIFRKGNPRAFGPDDEYVVAFRGSDFSKIEDWVANGQVVLPVLPQDRVKEAADLATKIEGAIATHHPGELRRFDFAGHSLGGRLAMVARHATGRDAVVFNSSPLSAREMGYLVTSKAGSDSKVVAFRSPQDPLALVDSAFAEKAIEIENLDRARIISGFREIYSNKPVPDESDIPDPDFTTVGSSPAVVEGGEQFREWVSYNHSIVVLANAMQEVGTAFPRAQQQHAPGQAPTSAVVGNRSAAPSQGSNADGQSGKSPNEKVKISCEAAQWEGLVENVADLFECDSIRAMQSLAEGRRIKFYVGAPKFSQGAFSASMRANPTYMSVFQERAKSGWAGWFDATQNRKPYTVRCTFPTEQIGRLNEDAIVEADATLESYSGTSVYLACSL